jgi:phosphatidylserine/phosphatidylglycerophosphate/cardiolipin synthase-like enzyme
VHQRIRKTLPKGNGAYESADCGNNTRTSKVKTFQLPTMLDPGFSFLIQDELHLLRESLGNFDAHYETLLQALQVGHGGQPSKVLAATAIIADSTKAYVGSANFTNSGLDHGIEAGVMVEGEVAHAFALWVNAIEIACNAW